MSPRRYCPRILISPLLCTAEITFPPPAPLRRWPADLSPPLLPVSSPLLQIFSPPAAALLPRFRPVCFPENHPLSSRVSSLLPPSLLFYQSVSASSGQGLSPSLSLSRPLLLPSLCLAPLALQRRAALRSRCFSPRFFPVITTVVIVTSTRDPGHYLLLSREELIRLIDHGELPTRSESPRVPPAGVPDRHP